MTRERRTDRVPLADAAEQLGLSYHALLGRVLRGRIAGGQSDLGSWFVTAAGLKAALRQKRMAVTSPALDSKNAEAVPA